MEAIVDPTGAGVLLLEELYDISMNKIIQASTL
jgi:hypothetical protein